jgi:cell division protein FtsQ
MRALIAIAALAALVAGASGLSRTGLADVDTVAVTGSVRQPVDEILAASGISPGQPLLGLDEATAVSTVSALPWVAEASVTTDLRSGDVVVHVVERTPVAVLSGGPEGPWMVVDGSGRVVAPLTPGEDGLAFIEGAAPSAPATDLPEGPAREALQVAQSLTPGLTSRVEALVVTETGSVHLRLVPGGTAVVGDSSRLDEKIPALQTVLAEIDLACSPSIDVTSGRTVRVTRGACG